MKKIMQIIFTGIFLTGIVMIYSGHVSAEEDPELQNQIIYEYNEGNGLPTGEANTVLQAGDGYIWIGSYGGLIRYDGTTFRNFSKEGKISSSSIRTLFEDSRGRLWIGTNDRGVYCYENRAFVHCEYTNEQDFLSVRAFAEDQQGNIYVGTTSGLASVSEYRLEAVEEDVCDTVVYSLAVDENNVLWASVEDGKALLFRDGKLMKTFEAEGMEASVYCVKAMRDGALYLGTSKNMVYRVEFRDTQYQKESFVLHKYETGDVATVNALAQDEQGNVWVAALNGAGYLDRDSEWHQVEGKKLAALTEVSFDYEGNAWFASNAYGVIHLVSGVFYNANNVAGISETAVNAVAAGDGRYYLGTDTGLIILDEKFHPLKNKLTRMLQGTRVRHVLCDREGNVWIGTYYEHGLVLYEPESGRITSFKEKDGMSNDQIRMILECRDGSIAVASQEGVSILRDHRVVRTYTEKDGISYPVILCLCEGEDGTLYAGSDGQGIYAIRDDKVTQYGFEEGLPAGVVLRMLPDENGEGIFVSAGNGLYYWDFKAFRELLNYEKSPGSVFDLYRNGEDLWLMQSNGVHVLNRERLLSGEETPVRLIGRAEGLTGALNANTWNTEVDGMFYLCTGNGFSVLDTKRSEPEQKKIRIALNCVKVDDEVHESPDLVEMDGNATRLTFEFAPLSYSGRKMAVRYRLRGFDKKAGSMTNEQPMSVSYTNLSGGDYEFFIEVLDTDVDTETVLSTYGAKLHKAYRLWEHPWFWVLLALAVLLAIVAVIWLTIHIKTVRLKQRQAEYRNIINQSLKTFANTIDAKDEYTNGHSLRVALYSWEIAKKLRLSEEEQERIYYIALLHDIGKIGIADEILNKPGKLTKGEREIIMSHPAIGGDILKDFTSLPGISEGARYHHERYDGNGYNEGLKGEEIPFFARIICVADSYDAMSSTRCYRKDLDPDTIKKELQKNAGTQFDPQIVAAMLELIEEGRVPVKNEKESRRL